MNTADTNLDDEGKLTLSFTSADNIEAGKPYLIKWVTGENLVNPTFEDVTIGRSALSNPR